MFRLQATKLRYKDWAVLLQQQPPTSHEQERFDMTKKSISSMLASGQFPSIEYLREALSYNPETGALVWNNRPAHHFKNGVGRYSSQSNANRWNARCAGRPAFTRIEKNGYMRGYLMDVKFSAHRVCFAIHNGHWPKNMIDHKNGIKTDNRAANLRDVTCSQNQKNGKISSRNTSGCIGVYFVKKSRRWRARIVIDGKIASLGVFATFAEAVRIRKEAEKIHGYYENHGRRV